MGYNFTIENESGQTVFTVEVLIEDECCIRGNYTFIIRDENGHVHLKQLNPLKYYNNIIFSQIAFRAFSECLNSMALKDNSGTYIGYIQNQLYVFKIAYNKT